MYPTGQKWSFRRLLYESQNGSPTARSADSVKTAKCRRDDMRPSRPLPAAAPALVSGPSFILVGDVDPDRFGTSMLSVSDPLRT